jgi:glycosyltransferase involved in cell wall biosynthesis
MNVGINLLYLLPGIVGGTATYAVSLLEALAGADPDNRYFVFVNRESAELELVQADNFVVVACPVPARVRALRYAYEQVVLPRTVDRYRLDVMHSPGYIAPLRLDCSSVVTIPDLNYRAIPEVFTPVRRRVFESMVPRSARAADAVLTISEASRRQIVDTLGVPPEKVTVTHLAAKGRARPRAEGGADMARDLGIDGRYLMAFSSQSPHKNIDGLLRAFHLLAAEEAVQLVLVGHEPERGQPLRALVEELKLTERVVFAGYRSDEEVARLFQGATAFAFPSMYEGFGIPVLEAMEAGVPVVCSNAASLPEVAGDAALLFDPADVRAMASAMEVVLQSAAERERLIARGFRQARQFSWRTTAEQTLAVYQSVVARRDGSGRIRV